MFSEEIDLEDQNNYLAWCKYPALLEQQNKKIKDRLTTMKSIGMKNIGIQEFGFPGKTSGLYIERVWYMSDIDFDRYIKWARGVF